MNCDHEYTPMFGGSNFGSMKCKCCGMRIPLPKKRDSEGDRLNELAEKLGGKDG